MPGRALIYRDERFPTGAMGYVRKNFLAGLELSSLEAINHAARTWVKDIANVRRHPETQKRACRIAGGTSVSANKFRGYLHHSE